MLTAVAALNSKQKSWSLYIRSIPYGWRSGTPIWGWYSYHFGAHQTLGYEVGIHTIWVPCSDTRICGWHPSDIYTILVPNRYLGVGLASIPFWCPSETWIWGWHSSDLHHFGAYRHSDMTVGIHITLPQRKHKIVRLSQAMIWSMYHASSAWKLLWLAAPWTNKRKLQ